MYAYPLAQNANRNAEIYYFQYKIFGLEIYFLPFYSKFWVIFFSTGKCLLITLMSDASKCEKENMCINNYVIMHANEAANSCIKHCIVICTKIDLQPSSIVGILLPCLWILSFGFGDCIRGKNSHHAMQWHRSYVLVSKLTFSHDINVRPIANAMIYSMHSSP